MSHRRMIICAGIPSSASTWVFNVAAEIERRAAPKRAVTTVFSDNLDEAMESEIGETEVVVIKAHLPGASLRLLAAQLQAPVLLTVRSPHDCVVSLMQRFGNSFAEAFAFVTSSCDAVLRLLERSQPLILKYEQGFASGSAGIAEIARYLDRKLTDSAQTRIARKFSLKNVSAFIAQLEANGVFDDRPAVAQWDKATHWHPHHVGDGSVGKYRQTLNENQIEAISRATRKFRAYFGYEVEKTPLAPGATLSFSDTGGGAVYAEQGFHAAEPWGSWIIEPLAILRFPLSRPIQNRAWITLTCLLSPNFTHIGAGFTAEISINGRKPMALPAGDAGNILHIVLNMEGDGFAGAETLEIAFRFSNIRSLIELGCNEDTRPLALGLVQAQINFD